MKRDPREERDSIDRFLEHWDQSVLELDPAVEGIVDRIHALAKRISRAADETFAEFGLNHGEWRVLHALRLTGPPHELSPGTLAEQSTLSTGAMTNRLDRLEQAGLVRRRPNLEDRRALLVELTRKGEEAWRAATAAQAHKEIEFASALSDQELDELNRLLRRLMLVFERERRPSK
jgi:DNA-binding MarR family transcriptional regulator